MQSRMRRNSLQPGHPPRDPDATTMDPKANGRAKTVCENRIKVRKRERKDMGDKT